MSSRASLPWADRCAAGGPPPLRLLTFSTLYPNPAQPHHGVFVENRLRHLVAGGEAVSTVLAPVPWFPLRYPGVLRFERRHGIAVHHPRYAAPPGLGMYTGPAALLAAARRALAPLLEAGLCFDAIDAHYLYPDGVAAVRLGRELGLPVVITARGSDTSQLPRHAVPRRLIRGAIRGAAALVAVSAGLKEGLVALGAPADKVTVLRNGVDLEAFRPPPDWVPNATPSLLSVGHLIPRKGHDVVIRALALLPGHHLVVVGDGPQRESLRALAQRLGVAGRVRFAGPRPHGELRHFYGAADALVLASAREGWANVLLEAMACGTPVAAYPVMGPRDVVGPGGVLDENLQRACLAALEVPRATARAQAEHFSWPACAASFRDQLVTIRG